MYILRVPFLSPFPKREKANQSYHNVTREEGNHSRVGEISKSRRFGLMMLGMLLALSASCVFPLLLHAFLPRTYDRLFSLMSVSCLSLRPPAAMTDD